MKIHAFLAFLTLAAGVTAASAADPQRKYYVPCPKGYEGTCGDIPGLIGGAARAGEMICKQDEMDTRRRQVADWSTRMRQIDGNLTQIAGAVRGLGNQYAAQGKMPLLAQTADFTSNDLQARLVHPLAVDLAAKTTCYNRAQKASDGCYHTDCGDPAVTVKNLENAQPAIDRVEADLEAKRGDLESQLPDSIMVQAVPAAYNRCATNNPAFPCRQHMDRSLNQLVQAVQATSKLAGEIENSAD